MNGSVIYPIGGGEREPLDYESYIVLEFQHATVIPWTQPLFDGVDIKYGMALRQSNLTVGPTMLPAQLDRMSAAMDDNTIRETQTRVQIVHPFAGIPSDALPLGYL